MVWYNLNLNSKHTTSDYNYYILCEESFVKLGIQIIWLETKLPQTYLLTSLKKQHFFQAQQTQGISIFIMSFYLIWHYGN